MTDSWTHTPGPWTACFSIYDGEIVGFHIAASPHGSTKPVCESDPKTDPETLEGNARLIAAAPALHAALKNLCEADRDDLNDSTSTVWQEAAAAIRSAEGASANGS